MVTFFKVHLRKKGQGFLTADLKMMEDYRIPKEATLKVKIPS